MAADWLMDHDDIRLMEVNAWELPDDDVTANPVKEAGEKMGDGLGHDDAETYTDCSVSTSSTETSLKEKAVMGDDMLRAWLEDASTTESAYNKEVHRQHAGIVASDHPQGRELNKNDDDDDAVLKRGCADLLALSQQPKGNFRFTDSQNTILYQYYELGMVGVGKKYSLLHEKAVKMSGLSEHQVKSWIKRTNMRRKASGAAAVSSNDVLSETVKLNNWQVFQKQSGIKSPQFSEYNKVVKAKYDLLSEDEKKSLSLNDKGRYKRPLSKPRIAKRVKKISKKQKKLGFSFIFKGEDIRVIGTPTSLNVITEDVMEYLHALFVVAYPPRTDVIQKSSNLKWLNLDPELGNMKLSAAASCNNSAVEKLIISESLPMKDVYAEYTPQASTIIKLLNNACADEQNGKHASASNFIIDDCVPMNLIYEQIADDDEIFFEYSGIMIVKERNIYLSNKEESDELISHRDFNNMDGANHAEPTVITISSSPSKPSDDIWLPELHLTQHEKHILESQKWLNDVIMNASQTLLAKQSNGRIYGFQSTLCCQKERFRVNPRGRFIQVLFVSKNHWLATSNICETSDFHIDAVDIYDSGRPHKINFVTKRQICSFLKPSSSTLSYNIMDVEGQFNSYDCGVYAIAYATHLVYGLNPIQYKWIAKDLRKHLLTCLMTGIMEPFPTYHGLRKKSGSLKVINTCTEEIYCICRMPNNRKKEMIMCDSCRKWFHFECVQLCEFDDETETWYCLACKEFEKSLLFQVDH